MRNVTLTEFQLNALVDKLIQYGQKLTSEDENEGFEIACDAGDNQLAIYNGAHLVFDNIECVSISDV